MGLNLSMLFHHIEKTNRVVIEVNVETMPNLTLDMTPANFFRLVDAVVGSAVPFIEQVKKSLAEGKGEDIKVEFNTEEWGKRMNGEKV